MEQIKTNDEILEENWVQAELKQAEANCFDGVKLETLKLEENKSETIAIDISEPWKEWVDDNGTKKKIIPVIHQGTEKNFWLNTRNPIYVKLLGLAQATQQNNKTSFVVKVLRTGQQQNTRYVIIE